MKMNKSIIVGGLVGLVIGVAGTHGLHAIIKNDHLGKSHNTQSSLPVADHNAQTAVKLKDLKGDEFDKAFMEEMITHHQSAIDMAKLIETNARHDELKKLGQDILSAQSKEIDMMQTWQGDWGYKNVPKSHNLHRM